MGGQLPGLRPGRRGHGLRADLCDDGGMAQPGSRSRRDSRRCRGNRLRVAHRHSYAAAPRLGGGAGGTAGHVHGRGEGRLPPPDRSAGWPRGLRDCGVRRFRRRYRFAERLERGRIRTSPGSRSGLGRLARRPPAQPGRETGGGDSSAAGRGGAAPGACRRGRAQPGSPGSARCCRPRRQRDGGAGGGRPHYPRRRAGPDPGSTPGGGAGGAGGDGRAAPDHRSGLRQSQRGRITFRGGWDRRPGRAPPRRRACGPDDRDRKRFRCACCSRQHPLPPGSRGADQHREARPVRGSRGDCGDRAGGRWRCSSATRRPKSQPAPWPLVLGKA
jgi:hypothetical protein